jgi:hypothetical protein
MEGGGAKVRNKDRCLLEMDVIKAIDKHTREDGTLDDDISCILEEVESVDAKDTNVPSKWIPCSERLPENEMNVIAQFSSGTVTELRYAGNGIFEGIYEYSTKVIIAWMPLPEPYKGE